MFGEVIVENGPQLSNEAGVYPEGVFALCAEWVDACELGRSRTLSACGGPRIGPAVCSVLNCAEYRGGKPWPSPPMEVEVRD